MSENERTFIQSYTGFENDYLFVSYAHVDTHKVEGILNVLYRRGFRIWYDEGGSAIPAGDEWYPTIIKRIEKSSGFLAFISNATEHRQIVLNEISMALRKKREKPDYKVVFVFLEKVSSEGFPEKIKQEMQNNQFIDFKKRGGITEAFIEQLCNARWPDTIIDQPYRKLHGLKPWAPNTRENVNLHDDITWFNKGSSLSAEYEKMLRAETQTGSINFYALSPETLDPNTVYPAVMDNQWVPEELYHSESFYEEGVRGKRIAPIIINRQRQEILRSLIHNRQIVVNRASILNSKVFSDWYNPHNKEYRDFLKLLADAAILIYLFNEHSPVEFPKQFHIPKENCEAWLNTCHDANVCCLRLDWESEESNIYETDLLGYAFKNFCLSLADDEYMLNSLERVYQIPAKDKNGRDHAAFLGIWKKVQADVLNYRDQENQAGRKGIYRREQFYKQFLIDKNTAVDDGILDRKKSPFVKELKQIIDFYYSLNLPSALGIQLLPPSDTPLSLNMFTSENSIRHLREIDVDELVFSVSEFKSGFIAENTCLPQYQTFSLRDITALRGLREWRDYIRTITEGKKRASLDQLDFYATKKVWDRHTLFLNAAKKLLPDKNWVDEPAAISIIYYFDNIELITVYTNTQVRYHTRISTSNAQSALGKKSKLSIDYICCDALTPAKNNLLMTKLSLFEGITHTTGFVAYTALIRKFKDLGFIEEEGR